MKDHVLLANLTENFDDELQAKLVKIIGCHVLQTPIPKWLAHLP